MWYNSIIRWLLRSPIHGFMSKNTMLITYTGRKSGKTYTTPVNYVRQNNGDSDVFLTTSYRQRVWWRNLRGGVPVTLRMQGQDFKATAEVIEDEEGVAAGLMTYLQQVPNLAKYFEVSLNADGQPNRADVSKAAQNRVIIRMKLTR
jgi:deazaflavin-dependent oxidoreductase (nitroreductase family)